MNALTSKLRVAAIDNDLDISVVVPVHNEAGNVSSLATELVAALRGKTAFEVLFVDDGSDDGTATELARCRSFTPRCDRSRTISAAGSRLRS